MYCYVSLKNNAFDYEKHMTKKDGELIFIKYLKNDIYEKSQKGLTNSLHMNIKKKET